jgi:hypothetical protein
MNAVRCAYACSLPAVHADHVVPRLLQKKYARMGKPLPAELCVTVPACFNHNILKGTRRLVPPSWAGKVDELNGLVSGARFRVWHGSAAEPAFREVHV